MRHDMSKVHTEPSRRPDRTVVNARSRYFATTPLEELPLRENMRSPWNGFRRNQQRSYAPLKRFLASRVGQPWDKVYSEISRQNSLGNYAERETRDWLAQAVELAVTMVDDQPYNDRGHRLFEGDFWVDPRDGILKLVPAKPRQVYPRQPDNYPNVRIDDTHRYVLINDCWYFVTFAPLADGKGALLPKDAQDVILRLPPNADRWAYVKEWWADVYACAKQQISGKEIKRLKKQGVLPQ